MKKFIFNAIVLLSIFFTSCAVSLTERNNDKYGSLSYGSGNLNRAIDVDSITSAKVSVLGTGIDYDLSIICTEVVGGKGSFVIDRIPVGKNRIVTVQGYSGSELIEDALISVVIDINPGSNELLLINKETSCKGNVYLGLLNKNVDISKISESDEKLLQGVIPDFKDDLFEDIKRLDVDGIVADYLDEDVDLDSVFATDYVLPEEAYLQRLMIKQLDTSTETSPKFSLTAIYSDGVEKDVTSEAEWVVTSKNRSVLPEEFITIEDGVVSFAQGSNGSVEIFGKYTDPFDMEKKYARESTKAFLTVEFEEPKNDYIYFYNDPEPLHDTSSSKVNYALDGVIVAAWVKGGEAGSGKWYPLDVVTTEDQTPGDGKTWRTPDMGDDEIWKHPVWMRVEIPEGATDVYFARGKSLEKYDKESYLKGLHEGYPYNKTVTYSASDFGTNNVYTPTNWGAVHWYYCNTSGCEFGTKEHKITDGKWSSKTVEELAEELSMPELAEGYSFATVVMEPTDDDTSLSSLIINKTPVSISHRVVYTLPSILENENNTVIVEAQPNYKDASVVVDPISYNLANGESKEFNIEVTSKNGRNNEKYTVKVKRAPAPHVNPGPIKPSEKGICYILDNEEKVVTFVFEYDQWGYTKWNKEKIIAGTETHRVLLRGSFTRKYNESKGSWGEDTNTYVMTYDKNNDWYFINVPYEKLRPGYSGQVEYKFYVDRFVKGCTDADFIDPKTIFNEDEKDIMMFFGDETEERLQEIEANKPLASVIKELEKFNIAEKQDRADITNFRLVPGTKTLYRSYHPYYPSHSQTYLKDKDIPTEYVRIEELKKLIEEKGIKTDINLCQDRSDKVGSTYTVYNYDTPFRIDIPNCYKNIQNNNRVLYVGDKTAVVPGNDVIPEGEHVYYNSDSQYMLDWVKQIVDFINMDNSKAPFLIHCEIGVDRTGVFSAIFAGLCGASWEEIAEDYKMSNRMQIGEFRDVNVLEYSFERMLGVEDITKESDIKSLLVNYFTTKGGMTQADLDKTVQKLTSAQ